MPLRQDQCITAHASSQYQGYPLRLAWSSPDILGSSNSSINSHRPPFTFTIWFMGSRREGIGRWLETIALHAEFLLICVSDHIVFWNVCMGDLSLQERGGYTMYFYILTMEFRSELEGLGCGGVMIEK
ncbi:hypothetical protein ADUPG1_006471 [Aduncisulcus paluster]|uniref:Uncharacterized protein n=1 Tax=Aduncisulcus paluster TaxID=2918883 RepID=A0ABQ5KID1_9EUKA|nr:hypothetical protein ADUPG1_006471 [Aduncisulcus paluster]